MTGQCSHISKATTKEHKRFLRVYRQEVRPFYRTVRSWLALIDRAVLWGIEQQLIQGKEADLSKAEKYGEYQPTSMLEKVLADGRIEDMVRAFYGPIEKARKFTRVTAKISDWNCIRTKGDNAIGPHYMRIYGKAAKVAGQLANISTPFDLVNPKAVSWAAANTNRLVTLIANETKEGLRVVIADGVAKGKDMGTVGREIRSVKAVGLNGRQMGAMIKLQERLANQGLSIDKQLRVLRREAAKKLRYRGEMIARTETARAVSEGTLEMYKEAEIEFIRFDASADACIVCAGYDGHTYKREVGSGIIPIHPNCRCSWTPVAGPRVGEKAPKLPKPTIKPVKPVGVPRGPSFQPAKTRKKAEAWAKEHGLAHDVDYSQTSVDVANLVNKTLADEGVTNLKAIRPFDSGSAVASMQMTDAGGVFSYSAEMRTMKKMKTLADGMSKTGFANGMTPTGVVRHEVGHFKTVNAMVQDAKLEKSPQRVLWERILKAHKGDPAAVMKGATKELGHYSATNANELWAEAYRASKEGRKGVIAKEAAKVIKEFNL